MSAQPNDSTWMRAIYAIGGAGLVLAWNTISGILKGTFRVGTDYRQFEVFGKRLDKIEENLGTLNDEVAYIRGQMNGKRYERS